MEEIPPIAELLVDVENAVVGARPVGRRRGRRRSQGIALVEILIAVGVLVMTSLMLAYAFTSAGLSSKMTDRAVVAQASLASVVESVADVPYDQLLSWNGIASDRGDHTVTINANLAQVGLIVVEVTVRDDRTQAVLARLATYRAQGT